MLARMIQTDEDLFICDMAETYHVFDYKSLPFDLQVTLASGLRENSRIRCKLAGISVSMDTFLLAGMFDKISWLQWANSKASADGKQPPDAILPILLGKENEKDKETNKYADGEDFMSQWRRLGGK